MVLSSFRPLPSSPSLDFLSKRVLEYCEVRETLVPYLVAELRCFIFWVYDVFVPSKISHQQLTSLSGLSAVVLRIEMTA